MSTPLLNPGTIHPVTNSVFQTHEFPFSVSETKASVQSSAGLPISTPLFPHPGTLNPVTYLSIFASRSPSTMNPVRTSSRVSALTTLPNQGFMHPCSYTCTSSFIPHNKFLFQEPQYQLEAALDSFYQPPFTTHPVPHLQLPLLQHCPSYQPQV